MARMPNPRVLAEVLRSGNLRARLRAAREGLTGVRLQLVAAALDLGLLDALGEGPANTEQLAGAWVRSTKICWPPTSACSPPRA
jgi:hypothetical protein